MVSCIFGYEESCLPKRKHITASIYIKIYNRHIKQYPKIWLCVKNKQNQSGYTNKMHKKMSRYEYKLHIHTVDFKMLYVIISLVKKFM